MAGENTTITKDCKDSKRSTYCTLTPYTTNDLALKYLFCAISYIIFTVCKSHVLRSVHFKNGSDFDGKKNTFKNQ